MFIACSFVLLVTALIAIQFLWAERSIVLLDSVDSIEGLEAGGQWPFVSILFAARNEEEKIERGIQSMLSLDYPHYELVVIDDRSTDRTSEILRKVESSHRNMSHELESKVEGQQARPALRVVRVDELPEGWLGKCHALHVGAEQARGEWLLFTDADIHMRADTLRATISYAVKEKADHVTLAPFCEMPTWTLTMFVATFAFMFKAFIKPQDIPNPKRSAHAGVGAFNLVRRTAYDSIGGHASVRLSPDDDVKLGKELKQNGFSQRFVNGLRLISVPWYSSFSELKRGLEKNCFAGIDYRYSVWVASNIIILAIAILPWLLLFFTTGINQFLLALTCLLWMAMGCFNSIRCGYRVHHGIALPLGLLLFLFVFNRSVLLTLWRQGISWRDTSYSLQSLRDFRRTKDAK